MRCLSSVGSTLCNELAGSCVSERGSVDGMWTPQLRSAVKGRLVLVGGHIEPGRSPLLRGQGLQGIGLDRAGDRNLTGPQLAPGDGGLPKGPEPGEGLHRRGEQRPRVERPAQPAGAATSAIRASAWCSSRIRTLGCAPCRARTAAATSTASAPRPVSSADFEVLRRR